MGTHSAADGLRWLLARMGCRGESNGLLCKDEAVRRLRGEVGVRRCTSTSPIPACTSVSVHRTYRCCLLWAYESLGSYELKLADASTSKPKRACVGKDGARSQLSRPALLVTSCERRSIAHGAFIVVVLQHP